MKELISNRIITIDTLVWTNGMANWVPLQQTHLASGIPVPPPSPHNPASATCPQAEAKERVIYVLLAVLFGVGFHNFYAGYTNRAIIQLLVSLFTCGILWVFIWIWSVIEACTVTQDANGVRFK